MKSIGVKCDEVKEGERNHEAERDRSGQFAESSSETPPVFEMCVFGRHGGHLHLSGEAPTYYAQGVI